MALSDVSLHDHDELLAALEPRLAEQPFWLRRIEGCLSGTANARMHLAVFHEPFLTLLLDGKKTIESRFSAKRVAPYGRVARDDLILLKRSGGGVVGLALAGDPGFYALDAAAWRTIRSRFAAALCAPDERFWELRAGARYATLIPVRAIAAFTAFKVGKRDRRGWVVIDSARTPQSTLDSALEA
jgi:hypothetical protein